MSETRIQRQATSGLLSAFPLDAVFVNQPFGMAWYRKPADHRVPGPSEERPLLT